MRKRLLPFLILFLMVFVAFQVIRIMSVPVGDKIVRRIGVHVSPQAAMRIVADSQAWKRWWPGAATGADSFLTVGSTRFGRPEFRYNNVVFQTDGLAGRSVSQLVLIPLDLDSVSLAWTDSLTGGDSFLDRWRSRQTRPDRIRQTDTLLAAMRRYLDSSENVYGIRVFRETSKDSTLISDLFETPDSPATALIYKKLAALASYVRSRRSAIVNYPMIRTDGTPGHYRTMIAYPVDRELPDSGAYKFKRFLPWKMISAEVRGGEARIRAGYRQFNQYIQDYDLSVMANGFSFLVTDRMQQPDSNKWVTRFSAPIP